jgi:hypothetical protein
MKEGGIGKGKHWALNNKLIITVCKGGGHELWQKAAWSEVHRPGMGLMK